jgi:hypothetical protein
LKTAGVTIPGVTNGGLSTGLIIIKDADVAGDEGIYFVASVADGTTTNSRANIIDVTTFAPPTLTATSGTAKGANFKSALANATGVQGLALVAYGDDSFTGGGINVVVDFRNSGGDFGYVTQMVHEVQGSDGNGGLIHAVLLLDNGMTNGNADVPLIEFRQGADAADFTLTSMASDPSNLSEGDIWYNSTDEKLKLRSSSGTEALGVAPWINTAFTAEVDDGNSGAAETIDFSAGNLHRSTLTDNVTYTFTNPDGPAHLTLKMIQDVGGTNTVTWPVKVKWDSGTEPTWDTAGDAVNIAFCYFGGSSYYCSGLTGVQ